MMSLKTRIYLLSIWMAGAALLAESASSWRLEEMLRNGCYLLPVLFAFGLKHGRQIRTGLMSGSYVILMLSLLELDRHETIVMACVAALAETLIQRRLNRNILETLFHIAGVAIATSVAFSIHHSQYIRQADATFLVAALLAVLSFFVLTSGAQAIFRSLTDGTRLIDVWKKKYLYALPYHLVGASVIWLMTPVARYKSWQVVTIVLAIGLLVYRSYRAVPLFSAGRHRRAEEGGDLHQRVIETLALAIEARDHAAHQHLRRVQLYALMLGRELNLSDTELLALRAAAVLHDIGKLAIPEYILSKPGKLTSDEFERVKVHPVASAEILSLMRFPYPVVPIVLAHHERWDGKGYPYGLRGEEIPLGARILSVVDCFDALASDRSYRRALPAEKVMEQIAAEAGSAFDPRVVEPLCRRYRELEQTVRRDVDEQPGPFASMKVDGGAPAAGLDWSGGDSASEHDPASLQFLNRISAASREVHALHEMAAHLGNSLSLDQNLSTVAARLRQLVPHETLVVYIRSNGRMKSIYQDGEFAAVFGGSEFAVGEGLSGWVAEHQKPICNGNPSMEPAYANNPNSFRKLRSALVVPLPGSDGVAGVLALYSTFKDAFTRDALRILLGITSRVGYVIDNSLKYESAQNSAATDFLTALPNSRSLSIHLAQELARAGRSREPLAVVLGDLDGFKDVNDRFGHAEGDRVLKAVALALSQSCREYDYVARMGGDEFVVVLPATKEEAVASRIAEFRRVIERTALEVLSVSTLSLSAGAAFFPADGTSVEELLAVADARMYEEKRLRKEAAAERAGGGEDLLTLARATVAASGPGAVDRSAYASVASEIDVAISSHDRR